MLVGINVDVLLSTCAVKVTQDLIRLNYCDEQERTRTQTIPDLVRAPREV